MLNKTAEIGLNTVAVRCKASLEAQADWLLGLLYKLWTQGVPIEDGRSIQFGWSILSLRRESSGLLVVHEPDYSRNPFQDTRGDISCTIEVQENQNALAKRLKVDALPALFQDKVVLAQGCLSIPHIYLERNTNPPKGDSGWYIGPCESADKRPELEALYVYELLQRRPSLLQSLALPPGHLVVFQGDEIEAILDASNTNILG
jgi:hypothetical protein